MVFGHPVNKTLQYNMFKNNVKLINFRISLIEEEINEFYDACNKLDRIETLDALCDTLYVVYGACHVFGISCDMLMACNSDNIATNKKNMSDDLITKLNILKQVDNMHDIIFALNNIINNVYEIGVEFNMNIELGFDEVHKSNMSKVCKSEVEANTTVEWYKTNNAKYDNPSYRISDDGNYWIIYDATTSKILKSICFVLPKLDSFV